jgi:hypothetical protein
MVKTSVQPKETRIGKHQGFSNEACTTDLRMSVYISQYLQEMWLNEQQIRTCDWMYTKQHPCSKILKIRTEAECVTHDPVCQKNTMDYESASFKTHSYPAVVEVSHKVTQYGSIDCLPVNMT